VLSKTSPGGFRNQAVGLKTIKKSEQD